ncbi:hypothetical protein [Maricaulis salignorans]|uniref:DUF423 domain-containing protein n=1 Tax=Maricaulis salignorans TaxID=144026 RepID=A0A1G9WJE1_9PROT|nr:hypothetical protein [Maricaulis salignorans]SDM84702.1 hypothetical protein SAMN04488568_12535 [Maricaulis salignorans]
MTFILIAATAAALVTFAVHTFVGGVFVARPLLADTGLPPVSKWLNYYCWHITSVLIIFIAAGFLWLSLHPGERTLLFGLSALSATLSGLSIAVGLKAAINPLRFPSTSLFALIAALGWGAFLLH